MLINSNRGSVFSLVFAMYIVYQNMERLTHDWKSRVCSLQKSSPND
jgi:hypothetical protein